MANDNQRIINSARNRLEFYASQVDRVTPELFHQALGEFSTALDGLEAAQTTHAETSLADETDLSQVASKESPGTQPPLDDYATQILQTMIESLPIGIVISDAQGNIQKVNELGKSILGSDVTGTVHEPERSYTATTLNGKPYPASRRPLLRALSEDRLIENEEFIIHRMDGEEKTILLSAAPVHDATAKIVSAVAGFQDITHIRSMSAEKKCLVDEAMANEEKARLLSASLQNERTILETVFENSQFLLVYLDRDFNFVKVNHSYARAVGRPVEELIGVNHFELFPNSAIRATFEDVRRTGKPADMLAVPFVFRDDPLQRVSYWDAHVAPIYDASGEFAGFVQSSLNVTERILSRQEREKRIERLNGFLEAGRQMLTEKSLDGAMQRVCQSVLKLTQAQIAFGGFLEDASTFRIAALSAKNDFPAGLVGKRFTIEQSGPYIELLHTAKTLRLTQAELERRPAWWDLPSGHAPLNGLLSARLVDQENCPIGLLMVLDKETGQFTAEDEATLEQIANLASLSLQQKLAMEETQRRAGEMDRFFASMVDAVVVYDVQGNPTRANPVAYEICGEAVMQLHRADLARKMNFRDTSGKPYPANQLLVNRALAGENIRDQVQLFRDQHGRERVAIASAGPIESEGALIGVVVIWHEITEREEVKLALAQEEARLRAIINNAPLGIVVVDRESRIEISNPAAEALFLRALRPQEAFTDLDKLDLFALDGKPIPSANNPFSRALGGESILGVEAASRQPGSRRQVLNISSAPVLDSDGRVSGAVGLFADVTHQKLIERRIRRYNRDLKLLNLLLREVTATLELSQVFDRLLNACRILIKPGGASIWLWDEDFPGNLVCAAVQSTIFPTSPQGMSVPARQSLVGWVARHGESALLPEPLKDSRFSHEIARRVGWPVESILAVPLALHDQTLGVLFVVNKTSGKFTPYDRLMLETIAGSAAVAIENARLHSQAQESATLAERARLARDLHDVVSQSLFSTNVMAESLPRLFERNPEKVKIGLEQIAILSRGTLAEMRALLLELHPTALIDSDLDVLLRHLVAAMNNRSQMKIELDTEQGIRLPDDAQTAIFRIAQEGLNNAVKHSHATNALVALHRTEAGAVELHIVDDGSGFDPKMALTESMGLGFMRQRAQKQGIELNIESQIGRGAQITAVWQPPQPEAD